MKKKLYSTNIQIGILFWSDKIPAFSLFQTKSSKFKETWKENEKSEKN